MAKLTLADILTGYKTQAQYNSNNDLIETALENTLSRDGTTPNTMEANLDMNSFRVQNLGAPVNLNSGARLRDVGPGSTINLGRAIASDIGELLSIDTTQEQNVFMEGFHESGDDGDGDFFYDPLELRSNHNGVTIIDPTRANPLVWGSTEKTAWFASGGTGGGCWKRFINFFVSVRWGGAKGDGIDEDYQSIQSSINVVKLRGGGIVYLPVGIYQTDIVLIVDSDGTVLQGDGSAYDVDGPPNMDELATTTIRWSGSAGGTILRYTAISGASNRGLRRCGLFDIHLEGLNVAGKGLELLSTKGGIFQRFSIRDCSVVALDMGVVATLNEGRDIQHCVISEASIRQVKSTAGVGIRQIGDTVSNVSVNDFRNIIINHDDGVALSLNGSDSNFFELTRIFRQPGGTGVGVELSSGASDPLAARGNIFSFLSAGSGSVQARAGTASSNNNVIFGYSQENGAPDPGIADGANLTWFSDKGVWDLQSESGQTPTHRFKRASATSGQVIGQTQYRAMNTSSALRTVATIDALLVDDTASSEDGEIRLQTMVAGTNATRLRAKQGIILGAPTGGDTGTGTINATLIHSNGVPWHAGSGTPEGTITAQIGSLFSRTDGGAGTSFYVKESGTGNTGWVGK